MKAKIAIATGDPAGIGPEISLKAALDPAVRAACDPILVSDPGVIARHAKACGIAADIRTYRAALADADFSSGKLNVLDCKQPEAAKLDFGATNPVAGRASIAFVGAAVKAALAGEVDAVVGAPQNETSIAQAGIKFDGHPSFVARQTGTDENDVFMMLCFGGIKVAHATLHQSVRKAIESITKDKVARVIDATNNTLKQMGIAAPKIAVSGLNPHAGEGGLFGSEEIEIIKPAIEAAVGEGHRRVRPVRRRHHVSYKGHRRFHRHAARPGPRAGQAGRAERHHRADHRHADPVLVGCARQRA